MGSVILAHATEQRHLHRSVVCNNSLVQVCVLMTANVRGGALMLLGLEAGDHPRDR